MSEQTPKHPEQDQAEQDLSENTPGTSKPGEDSTEEANLSGESTKAEPGVDEPASEALPENPLETLTRQLRESGENLEAQKDKYLRLQADLDNYKKRTRKELADALKYANLPLLEEMMSIMDNMERALEATRQDKANQAGALLSGIEMVVQQMSSTFEKFGVTTINPAGEPFDPNRHEAVSVVETAEVSENHVVSVFRTGYQLHDRIVRAAMVTVAKSPAAEGKGPPGNSGGDDGQAD